MTGIKDIAKAAGVSPSTVSNVLNDRKNVSAATKKRILALCEQMQYYPNTAGRALKRRDNHTILFVFSDFDRSFFLNVIHGINDYAESAGMDLMVCTSKAFEKYMRNQMTSGCIGLDMRLRNELLKKTASEDYPVIMLDRVVDNPYVKSIVVNNYDAMHELVQRIVNCGYRKFSFIGGPENTDDNKERYRAFLDVLEENHLPFSRNQYYSGDFREKSGYTSARIMILSDHVPEVVVCANDNMAIGAMKAFKDHGLRVPADVAVTGFDDSDMASAAGLTTVRIPNYERGFMAAQSLVEMIRGNANADVLKITASVKWRKTVADKVRHD